MRARRRSPLATRLAWRIGLSTMISLLVFAAAATLIIGREEREEATTVHDKAPLNEVVEQVGLALALAAPIGVLVAVAAAWWLARRAVARVDVLIAAATRMTVEDLRHRLPVSTPGDELDALAAALNGLFARLDDGITLQRQFAADASHELRSPLAVLVSTLEVARRQPRTNLEWEAFVDRALDEIRHMAELVDALLMLARAGVTPRRVTICAPELIESVAERWYSSAAAAGVDLRSSASTNAALAIDRGLMEVAIGNIVVNAITHSPEGGTIWLEGRASESAVLVSVSDQGPGVPPRERERIFGPFVRGNTPAADRVVGRAGLGLGLAIARRVVERHGGQIRVEKATAGGAAFVVRLPRVEAKRPSRSCRLRR